MYKLFSAMYRRCLFSLSSCSNLLSCLVFLFTWDLLLWAGGRWRGATARWSSRVVSTEHPELQGRNPWITPKVTGHLRTVLANSLTAWGRVNSQISIYLSTHVVKLPGKLHPRRTSGGTGRLPSPIRVYTERALPRSVGPNDNLLAQTASLLLNTHRAGSMEESTENELVHLTRGFIYK